MCSQAVPQRVQIDRLVVVVPSPVTLMVVVTAGEPDLAGARRGGAAVVDDVDSDGVGAGVGIEVLASQPSSCTWPARTTPHNQSRDRLLGRMLGAARNPPSVAWRVPRPSWA